MKNRNPFAVFILPWVTFGIYSLVWLISTKDELNELGASIPSGWLLFIPFANIYWHWRYCEAVEELTDGRTSKVATFLLHLLLGPIGMAITQSTFNAVQPEDLRLEEGEIRIVIES